MFCRFVLCLAAWCGSIPAVAQEPLGTPRAAGTSIRAVAAPQERDAVLQLIDHARHTYDLRSGGQSYDLKVRFTVNSGGVTRYDGEWQMEDIFDPQEGLRWSATLPGAYSITRVSSQGRLYSEETDGYVPLRLHEVRAALFDPLPASQGLKRTAIRTAAVTFKGKQLTCLLFSNAANAKPVRAWTETEECIDPESGLLRLHSQAPGRYYTYDYSNALQLGSHLLPSAVTIYDGGAVVTQISVESLTEAAAIDPALFTPTVAMEANGRPVKLGPAQKLFRVSSVKPGSPVGTVAVFGLVTASGELVEAHSLQPSDPNSQAALDAARNMSFSSAQNGAGPQQYFVLIVRRFVPSP
jgi:hypothetical protein